MPTPAVPATEALPVRSTVGDGSPAGCDVLVIGGGPAGSATAIQLAATTRLAVVVADARTVPAERFGETLTPGISSALDRLGLADAFRSDGHLRCPGGISVWGRERPGYSDHVLDPRGPAWHIDRRLFETRLWSRAAEVGVDVRTATRAVGITSPTGRSDHGPAAGRDGAERPPSSRGGWWTRAVPDRGSPADREPSGTPSTV